MTQWALDEWILFMLVWDATMSVFVIWTLFAIRDRMSGGSARGSKELLQIGLNLQRLEERMDSHFARLAPNEDR